MSAINTLLLDPAVFGGTVACSFSDLSAEEIADIVLRLGVVEFSAAAMAFVDAGICGTRYESMNDTLWNQLLPNPDQRHRIKTRLDSLRAISAPADSSTRTSNSITSVVTSTRDSVAAAAKAPTFTAISSMMGATTSSAVTAAPALWGDATAPALAVLADTFQGTESILKASRSGNNSAVDVSRRFQSLNELGYENKVVDGFAAEFDSDRETLIVDTAEETDSKLAKLLATLPSFLKIYQNQSGERRATALAKLVVKQFGNSPREAAERYWQYTTRLRLDTTATSTAQTDGTVTADPAAPASLTLPLGDLIQVGGLDRHAAFLYKVLADRSMNDGRTGIACRLTRRWLSDGIRVDVCVRIDGSEFYVDMTGVPPRLLKEGTMEAKVFWSTPPERLMMRAARISFRELLPSKADHSATEFTTVWTDRRVFVRLSDRPAHSYHATTFVTEMDALAATRHTSIVRVRAVVVAPIRFVRPSSRMDVVGVTEAATSATSTATYTVGARTITEPTLAFVRDTFEGQPLAAVLSNDRRKWTFDRVLNAAVQLAEAVAELHRFGLMYRDLSPHTIIITPVGDMRVGDWSLNRYAVTPPFPVPPVRYSAPEHYESIAAITAAPVTTDSSTVPNNTTFGSVEGDVYSFGAVLYAIAVGSHPWSGASDKEVRNRVERREMPVFPNDVNAEIAALIKQCLQYDPAKRPTLDEAATRLRALRVLPSEGTLQSNALLALSVPFLSAAGGTLFDTKDAGHLRSKLQPLSTADTVTSSRERWLASIGTIDPYLVVAKRVDSPSFYVVHRPNGHAVFVTSGLWDPNAASSSVAATAATAATDAGSDATSAAADAMALATSGLPDIELLAEARESELGSDLSNCWLFQCLLEVACTAKRNYNKVRRLLKERQFATMEVLDAHTCLPAEFVDPTTGRACMLLGIDSAGWIPKPFTPPTNTGTVVQIVTARLLTLNQWRDSQEFAVGKRPLAARFAREGTHHISSIVVALRSIMKRAGESSADMTDAPNKYGRSDAGDRFLPPNSAVTPPDAAWSVQRLVERVTTAIQIDAAAKPLTPPRLTVPALMPSRTVPAESGVTISTPATIGSTLVPPMPPAMFKALISTAGQAGGVPGLSGVNVSAAAVTASVPASSASSASSAGVLPTPTTVATSLAVAVPTLEPMQVLGPIADYEPPVTSGVIVNALESSEIAALLCAIAIELRKLLAPNSTAPEFARSAAQTVYGVLGTQSQAYGWQHVSEYIRNPFLYTERTRSMPPAGTNPNAPNSAVPNAASATNPNDASVWVARGPSEIHEAIDLLQETGHTTVKRLIQRIDWLRLVFRRDNVVLNAEFIVQCVATDVAWVAEAAAFMKSCEERVAELLAKNPQRFNQFRELQKKGVQWPHSLEVRKGVEKTGFSFRPMMIKRDRCVCDTCGVELSGWRPWYDPRAFHDYSKHPPGFRALMYPPPLPLSTKSVPNTHSATVVAPGVAVSAISTKSPPHATTAAAATVSSVSTLSTPS